MLMAVDTDRGERSELTACLVPCQPFSPHRPCRQRTEQRRLAPLAQILAADTRQAQAVGPHHRYELWANETCASLCCAATVRRRHAEQGGKRRR